MGNIMRVKTGWSPLYNTCGFCSFFSTCTISLSKAYTIKGRGCSKKRKNEAEGWLEWWTKHTHIDTRNLHERREIEKIEVWMRGERGHEKNDDGEGEWMTRKKAPYKYYYSLSTCNSLNLFWTMKSHEKTMMMITMKNLPLHRWPHWIKRRGCRL